MTDKLKQVSPEWYAKGLKFSCTGCGRCCTGGPGYAWVNVEEIEKIAAYLNLSLDDFGKKYLRQIGNRYALLERGKNFDCIFLKGKQCQIYPVRPTQCQTFPFWPEAIASPEAWEATAKECEGICDSADVVPFKDIEKQRLRQVKADAPTE